MGPAGDEHDEGHDDRLEGGGDAPSGVPPDPMDRVWVHPSELGPARTAAPPEPRTRRWLLPLGAALLSSVATVVTLGLFGAFDDDPDAAPQARPVDVASSDDSSFTGFTERVGQGLVTVTATGGEAGGRRGAGLCVRHGGEILTSARVVVGADVVRVTTPDGDTVAATVVGHDPVTDLTLLAVDRPINAVPVSNGALRPGQPVWVVGAPPTAGAEPWVSRGVVTARDAVVAGTEGPTFAGFVETDAMPSGWAAGGALVDDGGAVAGLVIAPVDGSSASYAVPMVTVLRVASELRNHGSAAHGAFDVTWVDTSAGPAVDDVPAGSAAGDAGLRAGDVAAAVGGRAVASAAELTAVVRTLTPGATATVKILRAGESHKLDVPIVGYVPEPDAAGGGS